MSIQPQFESHRYIGEICKIKGQSAVECRLAGSEISTILSVHASVAPTECACADGEVSYGGKALISVVYEDGDRKICRAERGVEFFHKAEGRAVTPACFAKPAYAAERITWRREGSGVYISLIVDADICVYGNRQMEYLAGGEELICKKQPVTLYKTVCVSGETEGEDEFDCDHVGDILQHAERAIVHHIACSGGQVELEGEIALYICALKEDGSVCSYERLIPFRMQVPADEGFGEVKAAARVRVQSAKLVANTDEEKNLCRTLFTYTLSADCFLCIKEELTAAQDAFSCTQEITLEKQKEGGTYLTSVKRWVERVSGVASLSPQIEGEATLQAVLLPRAEIVCKRGENGMEAEGVIFAEVIFATEGGKRSATLSLPFLFPIDCEGEGGQADALVCGLSVRRKKSGEIEADATLKLAVCAKEKREWSYISAVEAGEAYEREESAFSVFLTEAGEGLWEVAKRLRTHPDELAKNNPALVFPLEKAEQIFVYRQIE